MAAAFALVINLKLDVLFNQLVSEYPSPRRFDALESLEPAVDVMEWSVWQEHQNVTFHGRFELPAGEIIEL